MQLSFKANGRSLTPNKIKLKFIQDMRRLMKKQKNYSNVLICHKMR